MAKRKKKVKKKSKTTAATKKAKKSATRKSSAKKTSSRGNLKKKLKKRTPRKSTKGALKPKLATLPKKSVSTRAVKLPDGEFEVTGGQSFRLEQLRGQKVVLFFYPRDMTPGCTIEGREFTQLKSQFERDNVQVFGVSRDSIKSHEKFKAKENYSVELISDIDEKLCQAFGVMKDKNMYGKKVRGIERSTFVLDEDGHVLKEWRGVKAEGHARDVLDYLQTTL